MSSRKLRDEGEEGGVKDAVKAKAKKEAKSRVSTVLDQSKIRGAKLSSSKKRSKDESSVTSNDSSATNEEDQAVRSEGEAKAQVGKEKRAKTENVHKRQRLAGEVADAQTATLYVWGFPFETDIEAHVKEHTDGVSAVRVHTWHESGRSRGCAHVDYVDDETLQAAVQKLNRQQVGERYILAERAKEQTFAPPTKEDGSRCCRRIFVKNLPYETNEDAVRELFAGFGGVKDVRIPLEFPTKKPKGFGYVEYLKLPDAVECMKSHRTEPLTLQDRRLQLDYAPGEWKRSPLERHSKPRGGGAPSLRGRAGPSSKRF